MLIAPQPRRETHRGAKAQEIPVLQIGGEAEPLLPRLSPHDVVVHGETVTEGVSRTFFDVHARHHLAVAFRESASAGAAAASAGSRLMSTRRYAPVSDKRRRASLIAVELTGMPTARLTLRAMSGLSGRAPSTTTDESMLRGPGAASTCTSAACSLLVEHGLGHDADVEKSGFSKPLLEGGDALRDDACIVAAAGRQLEAVGRSTIGEDAGAVQRDAADPPWLAFFE